MARCAVVAWRTLARRSLARSVLTRCTVVPWRALTRSRLARSTVVARRRAAVVQPAIARRCSTWRSVAWRAVVGRAAARCSTAWRYRRRSRARCGSAWRSCTWCGIPWCGSTRSCSPRRSVRRRCAAGHCVVATWRAHVWTRCGVWPWRATSSCFWRTGR